MTELTAERVSPTVRDTPAETFAELYERSFPRVYAYVASLLRDRSASMPASGTWSR
ncbi:MAG: hypothetical protein ACR2LH_09250 [Thermoleophilaceae bacterium]